MAIQFVCRFSRLLSVVVGWMLISSQPLRDSALAQTAPFYQSKTIRIIVGFTAGGLYDQYARVLARHMPKYIPGNPNIIVQNMPGAGSLTATSLNFSPIEKIKAALRGIKVVSSISYAKGEERPYGNRVYNRTNGISATGAAPSDREI